MGARSPSALGRGRPAVAKGHDVGEVVILSAAERLRARDYEPSPGPACRRCEVRTVCKAAVRSGAGGRHFSSDRSRPAISVTSSGVDATAMTSS